MFSLDDYCKEPKNFVINSSLWYVCLSAPLLGFCVHREITVQRCSRAVGRKLDCMAVLFALPNWVRALATPGKGTALCWLYCTLAESFVETEETRSVRRWGNCLRNPVWRTGVLQTVSPDSCLSPQFGHCSSKALIHCSSREEAAALVMTSVKDVHRALCLQVLNCSCFTVSHGVKCSHCFAR